MPMHGAVDVDAYNARIKREEEEDKRTRQVAADQQKWLDDRGLKNCLNNRTCGQPIPVAATKCPDCNRPQGLATGGTASGAARTIQVQIGGAA